ncbi:MAG: glutathione peroxidase [Propionibacteriaceae bacterium]|jgi:glutathione peroxidase|nr:glutathione peroxidase [Propionibacteriaceae bacterium]
MSSVYDFDYTSIEGKPVSMKEYAGKVLIIVNTASKCGFTPQYEGLEALYEKYGEQGFVVVGFPCDQFKGQEPGTEEEIAEFCQVRFGVTFPLSKKVDVRDEGAIPLFRYLTSQKGFEGFGKGVKAATMTAYIKTVYGSTVDDEQIKWNFTKFLIDREGNVVARYEPTTTPESIAPEIERLLG